MATELVPQQPAEFSAQSPASVDPHGYLRPAMRVTGTQGKALGKVADLEHDAESGRLVSLTVRHGLLRPRVTAIPASRVKWVNQDSVVLELSPDAFRRLPRASARGQIIPA